MIALDWPPPSQRKGGPDRGHWILLATVHKVGGVTTVPVLEPGDRTGRCRRYNSAEEALADAASHSALRVGGGLAVNVCTGKTVMVPPQWR